MLGCRRENKGESSEWDGTASSVQNWPPTRKTVKAVGVVDERANDGKHSNRVKNDDDDSFANTWHIKK